MNLAIFQIAKYKSFKKKHSIFSSRFVWLILRKRLFSVWLQFKKKKYSKKVNFIFLKEETANEIFYSLRLNTLKNTIEIYSCRCSS
jgi:hypothetical protein